LPITGTRKTNRVNAKAKISPIATTGGLEGLGRLFSLGLLLVAAPLQAQDAVPWRASYFPYVIGNPTTGLMLVAHYNLGRQADYSARVPFDGIVSADAGWSTNGSRFLSARFRAPLLVAGWRFAADAGAGRENAFRYRGEGPDGSNQDFAPGDTYPERFFQVRRTRYYLRGDVTRRIRGPLSVALWASLTHFRSRAAEDGSLFDSDYLSAPLSGTDAVGRLALLFDTRDNEVLPSHGLLLEAGVYRGTGRFESRFISPTGTTSSGPVPFESSFTGKGYAAGYAHLRGYVSPRSGTVFAARLTARSLSEEAPLDSRYTIPGWEREITVLGGPDGHRSFVPGRFAGRGMLLGSLEVRHNLLDVGVFGGVTLIAFVDGGRTFGRETFRATLSGWRVGGGGGVGIRILQSELLVMNFAGGPDGLVFSMGNGWAF
jgi:hypothetical protein